MTYFNSWAIVSELPTAVRRVLCRRAAVLVTAFVGAVLLGGSSAQATVMTTANRVTRVGVHQMGLPRAEVTGWVRRRW